MFKTQLLYPLLALTCLSLACGDDSASDDATGSATLTETGTGSADDSANDSNSEDGGTSDSAEAGDGDSGDGDSGDGDSGDGDSGDGDSGDGDSGDGDSGDGDSGDGDSGDGDSGDGDSGDGDSGDGDSGDGDSGDGDSGDGDGDSTGGNPDDNDNDGIPNDDDPFPDDPLTPGVGQPNLVYAHTSNTLFTMNVNDYTVSTIGAFTFDSDSGSITDIALDRWGVLYAVSFNDVFVCNAQTAACNHLGDLPTSFNGLTMVPPGTIDPGDDTLIGIANTGNWYRIDAMNGMATVTSIGAYGGGYTNSGDVFSIQGVGTYGAANGSNGNTIVICDAVTGAVQSELTDTVGYSSLWGLAGWSGSIFGFNSGGEIIEIDPGTGVVTEVADTPNSWWGAGVFSILPE